MTEHFDVDIAVIGGGPAGLAAAIAAREEGFSVLVLDAARPPIDKACGEGLMPDGLAALRGLGIDIGSERGHSFRGIRFISGRHSVHADFPTGAGLGVRRTILHQLLIDRAGACGAELRWGTTVTGVSRETVRLGRETVRCRWIVGADGIHSLVRRWAGLDSLSRDTRRFGFRAHYRVKPWSEYMQIYWGEHGQMYVTPVSGDEVCVVVMSPDPKLRLEHALAEMPEIAERLAVGSQVTQERGALTSTRTLKRIHRDGVVLIGDASGSVDAITGEGLCLSFHQAVVLADALSRGNLEVYAAEHRRLLRRPSFMAGMMLTLGSRPRLRDRAVRALSSRPPVFATMLAMHVGAIAPVPFAAGAVQLGWQMLMV